jgi:hypothetical protein
MKTTLQLLVISLYVLTNGQILAQGARDFAVEPIADMTRLPGWSPQIKCLVDGTLVSRRIVRELDGLPPFMAIFTASVTDPLHWKDAAIHHSSDPPGIGYILVGGGRDELYYCKPENKRTASVPLRGDRPARQDDLLGDLQIAGSSSVVRYASINVGAVSDGLTVHITTDAGSSWGDTYLLGFGAPGKTNISDMQWIGEDRLLVSLDSGNLSLYAHENNTLSQLWGVDTKLKGAQYCIASERLALAISGGRIVIIDVVGGRIEGSVEPGVSFDGAAICSDNILVWQANMLTRISRKDDDEEYAITGTISIPELMMETRSAYVAGVFPFGGQLYLIFTYGGDALELDVESLQLGKPVPLRVEIAARERYMDRQQRAILNELMKQLPIDQFTSILNDGLAQQGMTRNEQIEWAIEKMNEAITALPHVERAPKDLSSVTKEQKIALLALSRKITADQRVKILEQSHKMIDFTPREQMEWAISQMQAIVDKQESSN